MISLGSTWDQVEINFPVGAITYKDTVLGHYTVLHFASRCCIWPNKSQLSSLRNPSRSFFVLLKIRRRFKKRCDVKPISFEKAFSRGSRFAPNFIQNLYTVLKKRLWESRSTPTLVVDSSSERRYRLMHSIWIQFQIGLPHVCGPYNTVHSCHMCLHYYRARGGLEAPY
jgi:hypothetical protein